MDWLTFISKIIDSLAWPTAILVLLVLLRKELPLIFKYIKKLKYKDLEMEFRQTLREVEKETKEAIPEVEKTVSISGQTQEQILDRLGSIAELAPRSAILEAWLQVETAAVHILRSKKVGSVKSMPGPLRLRDYLIKNEVLDSRQGEIFNSLRILRNDAVHVAEVEFTPKVVDDYIVTALKMASYLEAKIDDL